MADNMWKARPSILHPIKRGKYNKVLDRRIAFHKVTGRDADVEAIRGQKHLSEGIKSKALDFFSTLGE